MAQKHFGLSEGTWAVIKKQGRSTMRAYRQTLIGRLSCGPKSCSSWRAIPVRCPTLTELPSPPPGKAGWPWTEESLQLPDTLPQGSPWPRISIVTPSYNQGQFVEETIRSVLLQGYPDLEYVVMDGGSTDGSVEIIRKYETSLSYLHIGPDGGQSAAIGEGFRHATGEIWAWLNSDDRYRPGALGRVAHFFARDAKVVLGNGDANVVNTNGRVIKRWYAMQPSRFLAANFGVQDWPQQACFWRSWAYKKAGGMDRSLQYCLDLDLFIRLMKVASSGRIPGPPLADFRVHDRAKSSTIVNIHDEERAALVERYGNPRMRSRERLLRLMRRFWHGPVALRSRLNRACGWEW